MVEQKKCRRRHYDDVGASTGCPSETLKRKRRLLWRIHCWQVLQRRQTGGLQENVLQTVRNSCSLSSGVLFSAVLLFLFSPVMYLSLYTHPSCRSWRGKGGRVGVVQSAHRGIKLPASPMWLDCIYRNGWMACRSVTLKSINSAEGWFLDLCTLQGAEVVYCSGCKDGSAMENGKWNFRLELEFSNIVVNSIEYGIHNYSRDENSELTYPKTVDL